MWTLTDTLHSRLREIDMDDETGEKSAAFTPERVAELQELSTSAGAYERLAHAIGTFPWTLHTILYTIVLTFLY